MELHFPLRIKVFSVPAPEVIINGQALATHPNGVERLGGCLQPVQLGIELSKNHILGGIIVEYI